MIIKNGFGFKGIYKIDAYDCLYRLVWTKEYENIIVQNFYDAIWAYLNADTDSPAADDIELNYFATGDGETIANISDTTLENEIFRKQITSKSYTDSMFTCKLFLGAVESNFNIKEIGLFANGTSTPNSGTLISRCNVDIIKLDTLQYDISYRIERV